MSRVDDDMNMIHRLIEDLTDVNPVVQINCYRLPDGGGGRVKVTLVVEGDKLTWMNKGFDSAVAGVKEYLSLRLRSRHLHARLEALRNLRHVQGLPAEGLIDGAIVERSLKDVSREAGQVSESLSECCRAALVE